ncbi:MAG: hypothetical protein KBI47_20890, partial [Armatimonadetes bacterium]|nr:hypothetical protein [Armatimonadota bacterium]
MPEALDVAAPLVRLSPPGGQFFFGYYDLPAADARGRHLCLQVPFRDHFPTPGDKALLGWLPLPTAGGLAAEPQLEVFGETVAWNFQQGCMLQWLAQPDVCLYNTFGDGAFGCCIHNLATGAQRHLPRAVTNVAQDGTKAVCVNMARIYDFRPGYGYEEIKDPFTDIAAPADDGVYMMDLATGDSRMVTHQTAPGIGPQVGDPLLPFPLSRPAIGQQTCSAF